MFLSSRGLYGISNFLWKSRALSAPYMLSPIMSTNSYGKRWCVSVNTLASRYWFESPVPLSPMTANLRVSFGLFGRVRSWAARPPVSTSVRANRVRREGCVRMDRPLLLRNRIQHVIHNQVGLHIQQQQVLSSEPVLNVLGQRRKRQQDVEWNSRQRHVFRVLRIHLERHFLGRGRVVLDGRFVVGRVGTFGERWPQQTPEHRLGRRREDVSRLCAVARLAHLLRHRLLGRHDVGWFRFFLQLDGRSRRTFFAQLHVIVDTFREIRDQAGVGIHVVPFVRLLWVSWPCLLSRRGARRDETEREGVRVQRLRHIAVTSSFRTRVATRWGHRTCPNSLQERACEQIFYRFLRRLL